MTIQGFIQERILKLKEPPGPIASNLTPQQRVDALTHCDQWVSSTRTRLGELQQVCPKVGLGAAVVGALGASAAIAGGLAGTTATLGPGLAVALAGAFVFVAARMFRDKFQAGQGRLLVEGGKVATALQRARDGVAQLEAQAKAREAAFAKTVTSLIEGPRAGLSEEQGYLVMPGVRLRVRS